MKICSYQIHHLWIANLIFLAIAGGNSAFAENPGNNRALVFKRLVPPGITQRLYIIEKKEISEGVWKFRTQIQSGGSTYRPSEWRSVNCYNSTMDGNIISAIATTTVAEGSAEIIRHLCKG